jgi:6-pyruvoyltetrahydropterin/6-carboxytetrahydropterin synthase
VRATITTRSLTVGARLTIGLVSTARTITRMYELTVEATFSAAHALLIGGEREPLHGHDWHVTACVAGETLDRDGLLIDFHQVEHDLARIIAPFRNANLNTTAPFDRVNPSAENVAKHIADALSSTLSPSALGWGEGRGEGQATSQTPHARLEWVRITEAPGCAVTYRCS